MDDFRKLTDNERYVLLGSLSEDQMRSMLAFLKGYDEEAFQEALKIMGGGG
jgi:hypothetical protein